MVTPPGSGKQVAIFVTIGKTKEIYWLDIKRLEGVLFIKPDGILNSEGMAGSLYMADVNLCYEDT